MTKSKSVGVRGYQPGDFESCRALWRELVCWHREIYGDSSIGGCQPEGYFDEYLAKHGSCQVWVAVSNSRVVGFTGLIVAGNEAQIEPLIVSPSSRRRGIGKKLLETAVYQAQSKGVRFLSIKPVARNVQVIKYLFEQGFTKLGQVELFMDFTGKAWKQGPELFGCKFSF